MTPDPESASKSGSLSPVLGWIRVRLDQVNVLFWGTEGLRWPSPCMSGLQLLLTWSGLWWLSPSSLQKHKEQRGSSTRMLGSCPGLGLDGSLAFIQVSILFFKLIYLFLFSYNCLHFLPFPPPHPSQSHLPPPPLPSPLILSLCPF